MSSNMQQLPAFPQDLAIDMETRCLYYKRGKKHKAYPFSELADRIEGFSKKPPFVKALQWVFNPSFAKLAYGFYCYQLELAKLAPTIGVHIELPAEVPCDTLIIPGKNARPMLQHDILPCSTTLLFGNVIASDSYLKHWRFLQTEKPYSLGIRIKTAFQFLTGNRVMRDTIPVPEAMSRVGVQQYNEAAMDAIVKARQTIREHYQRALAEIKAVLRVDWSLEERNRKIGLIKQALAIKVTQLRAPYENLDQWHSLLPMDALHKEKQRIQQAFDLTIRFEEIEQAVKLQHYRLMGPEETYGPVPGKVHLDRVATELIDMAIQCEQALQKPQADKQKLLLEFEMRGKELQKQYNANLPLELQTTLPFKVNVLLTELRQYLQKYALKLEELDLKSLKPKLHQEFSRVQHELKLLQAEPAYEYGRIAIFARKSIESLEAMLDPQIVVCRELLELRYQGLLLMYPSHRLSGDITKLAIISRINGYYQHLHDYLQTHLQRTDKDVQTPLIESYLQSFETKVQESVDTLHSPELRTLATEQILRWKQDIIHPLIQTFIDNRLLQRHASSAEQPHSTPDREQQFRGTLRSVLSTPANQKPLRPRGLQYLLRLSAKPTADPDLLKQKQAEQQMVDMIHRTQQKIMKLPRLLNEKAEAKKLEFFQQMKIVILSQFEQESQAIMQQQNYPRINTSLLRHLAEEGLQGITRELARLAPPPRELWLSTEGAILKTRGPG
jgi:hypothetical protein